MKFIKGFIIGAFVGFTAGNAVSEQQRQELVAKVRRQTAPVRDAVADNVSVVADAAKEQASEKIDAAGAAAKDKIAGGPTGVPTETHTNTPITAV